MLSEILFVLLVLAVAALMVVDLVRTRGESLHGHAEGQPYGIERAVAATPARGPAARTFSADPARAMPTVPALTAGLPPREMEASRAFDQMHQEMSRSAANDAELREKLNAIFVNLAHRSQPLVERQLRLVEDLEHGEQDAQRRAKLSKLNRIAMRMHRNSQNLLVVAGHPPSPGWNQPVTLAHLVSAALAEVEDNERVSSEVQPDIAVRGPAVNDLVNLLIELIENATSFSAAEMPVHIKGQILTSGGALVDITDRGIGMTAKEMADANQRLDNPPAPEIDVPKWMGLLVVARLAARHRIRVRLNPAELGGLTALVWLPDEILTHYAAPAAPGLGVAERGAAVRSTASAAARMNMSAASAARLDPAWSARGPQITVPAEPVAVARLAASGPPAAPGGDVGMVMPQADSPARMHGPPIYDEVESRWSRGGRDAPGSSGPVEAAGPAAASGPAAAGPVAASGPAASGLPRRPPPAPASPRAAPGWPVAPGAPNRPGATGRDPATGFQRGPSQSRAAPADEANPGGPEES